MAMRPIHISVPTEALFGRQYGDIPKEEEAAVRESLADRVLDQADFDRYDRDSRSYKFLRRLYYHLSRFSRADDAGSELSRGEARSFRSWIEGAEINNDPPLLALRSDIMGAIIQDELACDSRAGSYGDCPEIAIEGAKAMIVTHPTALFDENRASNEGIDAEVLLADIEGIPTVYLVGAWDYFDNFYLDEMVPTHFVRSHKGLHPIRFDGDALTLAGGYLQHCFKRSFRRILENRTSDRPLTIDIPIAATYVLAGAGFMSKSLGAAVEREDDPLGFLRSQVENLIAPEPTILEPNPVPLSEDYDFEICYKGSCLPVDQDEDPDPKVTINFR